MIKIYDDIVSKDLQDKILNHLKSDDFAWYLYNDTAGPNKELFNHKNIKEYLQFNHLFYGFDYEKQKSYINSDTKLVDELIDEIITHLKWDKCEIFRVKSNLQTQHSENKLKYFNTPHIDFKILKNIVCLYYVNDSDGDTIFFDNKKKLNITKKVSPKKGRFIIFDGDILHTGKHPIKSKNRLVININFRKQQ